MISTPNYSETEVDILFTEGRLPFDGLWRRDLVESFIVTKDGKPWRGPFVCPEAASAVLWFFEFRDSTSLYRISKYRAAWSEIEHARDWFGDVETDRHWGSLVEAANKKNYAAQMLLSSLYRNGWGVRKDDTKSSFWFQKAKANRPCEHEGKWT